MCVRVRVCALVWIFQDACQLTHVSTVFAVAAMTAASVAASACNSHALIYFLCQSLQYSVATLLYERESVLVVYQVAISSAFISFWTVSDCNISFALALLNGISALLYSVSSIVCISARVFSMRVPIASNALITFILFSSALFSRKKMNCLFVFWFWIYSFFFLFRYESSLHSWRWPHTFLLTHECSVSVSFLKRLLDLVNLTLKPQFHCIHLKISFQFYVYFCALRQRFHSLSMEKRTTTKIVRYLLKLETFSILIFLSISFIRAFFVRPVNKSQ